MNRFDWQCIGQRKAEPYIFEIAKDVHSFDPNIELESLHDIEILPNYLFQALTPLGGRPINKRILVLSSEGKKLRVRYLPEKRIRLKAGTVLILVGTASEEC